MEGGIVISVDNFGTEIIVDSDIVDRRIFSEHDENILRAYEAVVDGLAALIEAILRNCSAFLSRFKYLGNQNSEWTKYWP